MNEWPDLSRFDAVLFDLDGVLTPTADVHRHAWREMFTAYLADQGAAPYRDSDYDRYLDGVQRYQGVEQLLASRGLALPWGDPEDPPDADTVCGLGNRKNAVFSSILERDGVTPFPGAVALVRALKEAGSSVAVVSSSRNARMVLEAAGLSGLFPLVIGGLEAAELGLASKPAPDTFLHAAAELGVEPARSVVIEDALSGVQAGRAGGFGLTVGVGGPALLEAGADLVVSDLQELADRIEASGMDRQRFPVDEWRLLETAPPVGGDGVAETLFTLGNGYLGLRGNRDWGGAAYEHGTFINGFHETWPIEYPEAAYGFATVGQTIVNVPDAKTIRLTVNGETFDPATSRISGYERSLDFRSGELTTRFVWHTEQSGRLSFESRRLVSFVRRNVALFEYRLEPLDGSMDAQLETLLINREDGAGEHAARQAEAGFDPRQTDELPGRVLQPQAQLNEPGRTGLAFRTVGSGLAVAAVTGVDADAVNQVQPDVALSRVRRQLEPGSSTVFTKFAVWLDDPAEAAEDLLQRAELLLTDAAAAGAAGLRQEQLAWLEDFWERADVRVEGQPALQQAIRWNLLQLAQASVRADGRGVSAKGVSGSGYSGHYFWDTEIYVLPFLSWVLPRAARGTLELRHSMLPAARRRAATMSVAGALFPWRTINGEEASAYYPAGTAQYHINADIAHGVMRYARVTGDTQFLDNEGAEILIETARMWLSLGFFSERDGLFHIHSVTGPDEYSAVVNDNVYTNVMARHNLLAAAAAADRRPGLLGVTAEEVAEWRRAAEHMAVPFDSALGIHAQDAEFLSRQRWDLSSTPREKRPLLLHYHPLVIYRHQVLKQADLVLAQYLLAGEFTAEQKRSDFEYYDPLTTGDSTLSAAVQSIMAAEVGYPSRALRHFRRLLWTDLANLHGNTADGVHVAAMGGTWLALVGGFAGLRDDGELPAFDPRLPWHWTALSFRLSWRESYLSVKLTREAMTFSLLKGAPLEVLVRGERWRIAGTVTVPLADQGPRLD